MNVIPLNSVFPKGMAAATTTTTTMDEYHKKNLSLQEVCKPDF